MAANPNVTWVIPFPGHTWTIPLGLAALAEEFELVAEYIITQSIVEGSGIVNDAPIGASLIGDLV